MNSSDSFPQDVPADSIPADSAGEEKSGLPPAKPLRFDKVAENLGIHAHRNGDGEDNIAKFGASVFKKLVTGDDDMVGLVAYGLYKQNKYEWLAAFGKSCGRRPTADESNAYVLGEGTPRRLATYRQLAESALAARAPDPEARSPALFFERESAVNNAPRPAGARRISDGPVARDPPKTHRASLIYFVFMAALAVLCVWLLVHFGVVKM